MRQRWLLVMLLLFGKLAQRCAHRLPPPLRRHSAAMPPRASRLVPPPLRARHCLSSTVAGRRSRPFWSETFLMAAIGRCSSS
mmetsp:Transcript_40710/g.81632  ORF Transcript_40710/g.81632 Transcript_40710/m.81632 type:complete len:82 (-) Transcript_40710:251-496(-)